MNENGHPEHTLEFIKVSAQGVDRLRLPTKERDNMVVTFSGRLKQPVQGPRFIRRESP